MTKGATDTMASDCPVPWQFQLEAKFDQEGCIDQRRPIYPPPFTLPKVHRDVQQRRGNHAQTITTLNKDHNAPADTESVKLCTGSLVRPSMLILRVFHLPFHFL